MSRAEEGTPNDGKEAIEREKSLLLAPDRIIATAEEEGRQARSHVEQLVTTLIAKVRSQIRQCCRTNVIACSSQIKRFRGRWQTHIRRQVTQCLGDLAAVQVRGPPRCEYTRLPRLHTLLYNHQMGFHGVLTGGNCSGDAKGEHYGGEQSSC